MIRRIARKGKRIIKRILRWDDRKRDESFRRWMDEIEPDFWSTEKLSYRPLISVVVPVYNVASKMLEDAIESVLAQTYENLELILVDDCSTMKSVHEVLFIYDGKEGIDKKHRNKKRILDSRIRVIYRKENGNISEATNTGLAAAKGEFIAFMDCDDVLAPQALYEVAYLLNQHPEYDFIYSDEDKITESARVYRKGDYVLRPKERHTPFFKPDWSPDTYMCVNYTNHFSVYRASLVKKTGGLRTQYNGSQDYDFAFRFLELTDNSKVGHVDKILYHWRERAESVAYNPAAKAYAFDVAKEVKEEMLARRGLDAYVETVEGVHQYRIVYHVDPTAKVSIIVPSKDNYEILQRCLDTILTYTDDVVYEIIIVDNGSSEETQRKVASYAEMHKNIFYVYQPMDFNFSAMCNLGASRASGDYLLFLNDDIEIRENGWLSRMVGHAAQSHVGAVGAKLLYPGTLEIQHDGVINLPCGPSHALNHMEDNKEYYFLRNRVEYDWLAVTGACLLVDKEKYEKVHGFDESLPVSYNDIDFCFKLVEAGYYNVVRNDVVLYHHESITRGQDTLDEEKMKRLVMERERLYAKHPRIEGVDPFYNRNLGGYNLSFYVRMLGEESQDKA